jgi:hypothetical protein
VPGFINGLKTKIGKSNAISNKSIREAYLEKGIKISDARVRKIINFIRIKGLVKMLCASSFGYYVASNDQEFKEYLKGLEERINSQSAVYYALMQQWTNSKK